MSKIKELLKQYNAKYTCEEKDGATEYSLTGTLNNEPWGAIIVKENKACFVHGRYLPEIALDDPKLAEWVKAYTTGFDEFDALL